MLALVRRENHGKAGCDILPVLRIDRRRIFFFAEPFAIWTIFSPANLIADI